jgi:hypothetical protein
MLKQIKEFFEEMKTIFKLLFLLQVQKIMQNLIKLILIMNILVIDYIEDIFVMKMVKVLNN